MWKVAAAGLCAAAALVGPAQAQTAPADAAARRAAFLKIIDRPRVPLAPEAGPTREHDGLVDEQVTFAADARERVPTLIVKRAGSAGRRPVVIVLHGTSSNKEALAPRLARLAGQGFVAVAIDGRYHGARAVKMDGPASSYENAIVQAFRSGDAHPFLYDSVWDVMRLVDYLSTRADVDAARIGLTGISKGGMETYLAAAADPRIAAAVSLLGAQSFRWALEHSAWDSRAWSIRRAVEGASAAAGENISTAFMRKFYDRIAPGLYGDFDGPAMLPLIAPRPLLVINGDSDARTPMGGLRECVAAGERAYASAGVKDRFSLMIQANAGHEVTPAADTALVDWFVRWLKP